MEAEVIEGLRKLGIDPGEIRYVIISHAHGDHSGGAAILQQHGARVLILSNHTAYDGSTVKIPMLAEWAPGDPHPYVIGVDAVSRYLTVAEECSIAARMAEGAAPTSVEP